jgi:MFS transporter, PAT family, beta-lactamase induction signal transducer AmpG
MLFTAAVLVPLRPQIGWSGILYAIAAILTLWAIGLLFWREPRTDDRSVEKRKSMGTVLHEMLLSLRSPGALWLVLFVGTYKIGEEMIDPMMRPFLVDVGYKPEQLAKWIGSYGMIASLIGSTVGGLLVSRWPMLTAVAVTATLRAFSVGGEWYLTVIGVPSKDDIVLVTLIEHFCGGALTTAMFAYMMSRVNKAVGGTHFTLLACVELAGKFPPSVFSGVLAQRIGYGKLFFVATVLSFLFLLLLIPLRRAEQRETAAASEPGSTNPEP